MKKGINQGIFVDPKYSYLNIVPDQTLLRQSLTSTQTRGPYPASLDYDEIENNYAWSLYDDDIGSNYNFFVPDYEINNYLENPSYCKLLASRKNMFYTNSPINPITSTHFLFNAKKKKKLKIIQIICLKTLFIKIYIHYNF